MILGACTAIISGSFLMVMMGDTNVDQFVRARAMAFSNYEMDPTSYWRYYLWRDAIEIIKQRPFIGAGFGKHFQLYDPAGNLISTSPHNLYVMIAYHSGITGLLLYLGLLTHLTMQLLGTGALHDSVRNSTIMATALIVLVCASAYYLAYPFDLFTWLYVGLGVSVYCSTSSIVHINQAY
jgi:O-antigen ligase